MCVCVWVFVFWNPVSKRDLQRVIEDNRGQGIRPAHEWCSWKPPADSEDLEAREPIFLDFSENRNAPHTTAWRVSLLREVELQLRIRQPLGRREEGKRGFGFFRRAEDGVMYVITELAQSEALWER